MHDGGEASRVTRLEEHMPLTTPRSRIPSYFLQACNGGEALTMDTRTMEMPPEEDMPTTDKDTFLRGGEAKTC